ncbi:hypothetical protein [Streptomyces tendae]|uniref:hypothetical protein n=1 Tax=Streptomyces tendae TaxID=1932 RepID=UPI0037A3FB45
MTRTAKTARTVRAAGKSGAPSGALDHPADPDRDQALETATAHRDGWLRAYRDCFGFLCLVLRPTDA